MSEELTQTIENAEAQSIKCSSCGKDIAEQDAKYFEGEEKDSVICLCDDCIGKLSQEFEEATRNINWARGIIYGLGAGLVCGGIWYLITVFSNTIFSILALGVGFVVALAVSLGAGNKKGIGIQITSALITLLTLHLATGFCGIHRAAVVSKEAIDFGYGLFVLFFSPFYLLDILGWAICLFGVYVAFATVQKEKLKPIKTK